MSLYTFGHTIGTEWISVEHCCKIEAWKLMNTRSSEWWLWLVGSFPIVIYITWLFAYRFDVFINIKMLSVSFCKSTQQKNGVIWISAFISGWNEEPKVFRNGESTYALCVCAPALFPLDSASNGAMRRFEIPRYCPEGINYITERNELRLADQLYLNMNSCVLVIIVSRNKNTSIIKSFGSRPAVRFSEKVTDEANPVTKIRLVTFCYWASGLGKIDSHLGSLHQWTTCSVFSR